MKRLPAQAVLPFGRKERALNRQIRERTEGRKVRRGPGRPKSNSAGVSHQTRPSLRSKTALHVTVRASRRAPNLRARRRYSAIKKSFVKFCAPSRLGFRLVHFAVLSNHLHFVVEADSALALSLGMQKLLHSISRRLNALSVIEKGGNVSTKAGSYRALSGWIGRVFSDRYHAHVLATPTEMANAVRYVIQNSEHHYAADQARPKVADPFTSAGARDSGIVAQPRGFLLMRACKQYLSR